MYLFWESVLCYIFSPSFELWLQAFMWLYNHDYYIFYFWSLSLMIRSNPIPHSRREAVLQSIECNLVSAMEPQIHLRQFQSSRAAGYHLVIYLLWGINWCLWALEELIYLVPWTLESWRSGFSSSENKPRLRQKLKATEGQQYNTYSIVKKCS